MDISPTAAALIGGAVGAGVSGLFTLFSQWLTSRNERQRHFIDLCFRAASENLQRDAENTKAQVQAKGGRGAIAPLDLYLIHMLSLMRLSNRSGLSQEEMIEEWVTISRNTREAFDRAIQEDLARQAEKAK